MKLLPNLILGVLAISVIAAFGAVVVMGFGLAMIGAFAYWLLGGKVTMKYTTKYPTGDKVVVKKYRWFKQV